MPILRVLSITCHEQEDWVEKDDAYIRINDVDFWGPKEMGKNQTRIVNKDYKFRRRAIIKLYEEDDLDPDDFLGDQVITKDHIGDGEVELPFKQDDAHYTMTVEVLDDNKRSFKDLIG